MNRWISGVALAAAAGFASSAPAAVVISEVVYNEVGSNTTGEWVEIYNNGSAAENIAGFKIGDEETMGGDSEAGGMWQFPAGTSLNPGQAVVVTVSASQFNTVYGFNPTFELATANDDPAVPNMVPYLAWVNPPEANNMSNSNDQAILLDAADAVADAVSWGNTFAFDPGVPDEELDGQSIYRIDPTTDTNTARDWGFTPGETAAERSTPGTVSVPEPAGLGLLAVAGVGLLRRNRGRRA